MPQNVVYMLCAPRKSPEGCEESRVGPNSSGEEGMGGCCVYVHMVFHDIVALGRCMPLVFS